MSKAFLLILLCKSSHSMQHWEKLYYSSDIVLQDTCCIGDLCILADSYRVCAPVLLPDNSFHLCWKNYWLVSCCSAAHKLGEAQYEIIHLDVVAHAVWVMTLALPFCKVKSGGRMRFASFGIRADYAAFTQIMTWQIINKSIIKYLSVTLSCVIFVYFPKA